MSGHVCAHIAVWSSHIGFSGRLGQDGYLVSTPVNRKRQREKVNCDEGSRKPWPIRQKTCPVADK